VKHLTASRARAYGAAPLALVAASLLMVIVAPRLDRANVGLFYVLTVIITATVFGTGPGVLVACASFLAFNYFFFEPRYTLQVTDPQHAFQLAIFLGVAIGAGTLAGRARSQAQRAERHAAETDALYALSQAISAEVDLGRILATIAETTCRLLGAPYCAVLLSEGGEGERELASAGVTQPGLRPFAFPIGQGNSMRGALRVSERAPGAGFSIHEERLLDAIATQAYLAIDRAQLVERAAHTQALAESDRLKSALLSAVSHDLRTPLAVIKGASSALLADDVSWEAEVRRSLTQTIEVETDRLNRIVGNWLQIARIEAGALPIERDWQDIADLVGIAVLQCIRRFPAQRVALALAPDLPLVWANAALLDQVLTNLLENAARYSPPGRPVTVAAREGDGDTLVIAICDDGPGIAEREREQLFQPFFRGSAAGQGQGSGLGLAICKGIVEAHGGQIWVSSAAGGGSIFSFTLPTGKV
jgi:two-component system sensor histidine kinase KdpD